ncbi:uncharacterized protein LOC141719017 [Apium graveolens]|uniref:uncharacterized protein LOC141719017 n=1 Tax=Apium graveolens TaxID=4045 RepID=UPI003D7B3539
MVTEAAMMKEFINTPDEPQGRDSRPGKSFNHPKERLSRGKNLMTDYFVDCPIFNEDDFRRRFTKAFNKGEQKGFLCMIGSIDCMNWEWKNFLSGWGGAYSGRKGRLTIILEAVASYDIWIWHTFFGVPRAQNDTNVLDGIYPRYSTFLKTLSNPATQSQKLFAKKQEAYRKNMERCFGILQSRWAILCHGARMHKNSTLKSIMITCIILLNMIVEDEFVDEDFVDPVEEDLMNPLASQVYDGPVDSNGVRIPFTPVQRNGRN